MAHTAGSEPRGIVRLESGIDLREAEELCWLSLSKSEDDLWKNPAAAAAAGGVVKGEGKNQKQEGKVRSVSQKQAASKPDDQRRRQDEVTTRGPWPGKGDDAMEGNKKRKRGEGKEMGKRRLSTGTRTHHLAK
ncbi:hypothetical protein TWF106_008581 [Orbilia oligospora]|uniref:Uncharacterized protein n=1 Tax=Orbilia oligospora TaxID=2813651 RepID=A0A6G1LYG0_ORBOL|nr:hypothetical protein TWF788_004795 [Orbilia oligospora]KAF3197601.1 hypothetical protein TWF679_002930 [Orbilia oligospora]KAF3215719.1 hypothetical protein TWF191_009205 [Orbilia oligospora]KAF3216081.1 hypothetical protein TWF106_008581 [Orbilia oligospora]KAF3238786.1 hypothetical protein TWF192_010251 [Orbilia oligospora]